MGSGGSSQQQQVWKQRRRLLQGTQALIWLPSGSEDRTQGQGGDSQQAKNYRPICVLPILYKLFAIMLQKRLTPALEAALSKEQAGFRKN